MNIDSEICTVQCIFGSETLNVVSLYRPHSGTIDNFTLELERVLQHDIFRNHRCIITGDMNLNLLDIDSNPIRLFVEMMNSYHFFH